VGKRFHPATKAKPGNLKALKHGATSEQLLAPLRQRFHAQLRIDFPDTDDRVLAMLASRMAKIEQAESWLEERGVIKNEDGDVYPIADRVEKWSRRAEDLLRSAGVQHQAGSPVDLAMAIAELAKAAGG
jgi:hypothetical protein